MAQMSKQELKREIRSMAREYLLCDIYASLLIAFTPDAEAAAKSLAETLKRRAATWPLPLGDSAPPKLIQAEMQEALEDLSEDIQRIVAERLSSRRGAF
jgi:hypothetical protein